MKTRYASGWPPFVLCATDAVGWNTTCIPLLTLQANHQRLGARGFQKRNNPEPPEEPEQGDLPVQVIDYVQVNFCANVAP